MRIGNRSANGFALVLVGTLLYAPPVFPNTGWVGYVVVLPATLLLTYGTLLVGKDTDGHVV